MNNIKNMSSIRGSVWIRLLSYLDIGLCIITGSVYMRTLSAVMRNNSGGMNPFYCAGGLLIPVMLLVIAVLCLSGKRQGLIAALLVSALTIIASIAGISAGGYMLIVLDGCESGVSAALDAMYYSALFIIGGGFFLLLYMFLHVATIYVSLKENNTVE